MDVPSARRFDRYVAIGDSSTEGLDDPAEGGGYRGWSRRLALRIAEVQGSLEYANLAVRGRTTRQILDQQLAPALALRPDLVTAFSGTNDLVTFHFDARAVTRDMETIQRSLIAGGATVMTFTLPDFTPVMPIARGIAPRIRALNEGLRRASARTGAILIDFALYPVASDPRLWSDDRIHANAIGHGLVADALAYTLGLPGTDDSWSRPLAPPAPRTRWEWLAGEMSWMRRHVLPWIGRRMWPSPKDATRPRADPVLQRLGEPPG